MSDTLPILTASEMKGWDAGAIESLGVPGAVLMESAGRAAAGVIQELYPTGRVVAAVGRGKNGGDAVVVLRTLKAWGRDVAAVAAGDPGGWGDLLHGWEIRVVARDALRDAAVIVDGLLGTGAEGAPRAMEERLIRAIGTAGRPVVALDGPSGVDLTRGTVAGEAVRADVTITFGALKRGLLLFPGREHAGRIVVVEIGLPPLEDAAAGLVTPQWAASRLPRRSANAHKGGSGTLAVVAGHPGMGGAAILVAMGALRAGSGRVRTVSSDANRIALQVAAPEGLFVDRDGDAVGEVLETADAAVVGPGMGMDDRAVELLRLALEGATCPLLLDADALTLVSRHPDLLAGADMERVVMTPHPGEMSRLLAMDKDEVVADPFAAAAAAAERFGCVVLLKGSPSLIAAPGRPTLANVAGHSGIATSGMGDTLAGIIGAFLGAGVAPRDAAASGLLFAGRAADVAGLGHSILPRDVAEALPRALGDHSPFGSLRLPGVLLDLPAAR